MSNILEYNVNILNSSGTKLAMLGKEECTCKVYREINGAHTINLLYPIPPESTDKSTYLTTWAYRIQIYNLNNSTYETFIITKTEKVKDSNGGLSIVVEGEAKAFYDLSSTIINATHDFKGSTPTSILTTILSYVTGWSIGTVEPTDKVSVYISYETAQSALQKLVKACGGEIDIDEVNSEIDLLNEIGENNSVQIRADKNLVSINNTQYSRDVINKMYGVGGGQPVVSIADARHVVSSYDSGTGVLTCEGNKIVSEDDSWNTDYEVYFETGSEAGNAYTITDCTDGSSNDTLTINSSLSIASGDKFRIRDTSHNDIDFIRAGSSIASYGTIEGVYKNSSYMDVINLINTPALDGAYTTGLCENWTKNGSPTVSENTTDTYITYGSASQRIQGTADEEGIHQTVTLPEVNRYWTITTWLYIASGTVKVELYDGSNIVCSRTTNLTGWQRIEIKERIASTTLTIRIRQEGAGTSDFYIDAVQVNEGILSRTFSKNCDAKLLWDETYDKLINKKDPLVKYNVRFIDLYKVNPSRNVHEEISIGDTVTIYDTELNIENLTARVKKINWNVFVPEETIHEVSNV